jgi:hypothetical protein
MVVIAQCAALTAESQEFLEEGVVRVTRTSFSNFLGPEERAEQPSNWKVNAIVLLVLYPLVMAEIIFLYPHLPLPLGPQTFIGNAVSVFITGFFFIPWAARGLNWWLAPSGPHKQRVSVLGWVAMFVGYGLLVLLMSWLAGAFL